MKEGDVGYMVFWDGEPYVRLGKVVRHGKRLMFVFRVAKYPLKEVYPSAREAVFKELWKFQTFQKTWAYNEKSIKKVAGIIARLVRLLKKLERHHLA